MFLHKNCCLDLRELLFFFRLFVKIFLHFSIFVVCDRDCLSSDGFHVCASLFFFFFQLCLSRGCVHSRRVFCRSDFDVAHVPVGHGAT